MKYFLKKYCIREYLLQFFLSVFLFVLPWQTILITREIFLNGTKWQYGTLGFFATEILLWICFVLFASLYTKRIKEIHQKKLLFVWSNDRIVLVSVFIFVLYIFSSVLWSGDKALGLQHALFITEAVLLFFTLYTAPLDRILLMKYFVGAAIMQSCLGIYQFLTQSSFSFKWLGLLSHPVAEAGTSVVVGDMVGRVMRAYAAFSHPNVFGAYLFLSLIFTSYILFKKTHNSIFSICFQIFCISVQVLALFFTFSRAAWIVSMVFFIAFFIVSFKNGLKDLIKVFAISFCLCIPFVVYFFPLVFTRLAHESNHEIQSTSERVLGYKESIQIWKTSPVFGVGAGNYTVAAYQLNPLQPGYSYQPVHNVPLLLLSEFGVVGLLLLFGVIITFYRLCIESSFSKYQILFFSGIFVFLSLFDHYFYSSYIGLLMGAIYFAFIFRFSLNKV